MQNSAVVLLLGKKKADEMVAAQPQRPGSGAAPRALGALTGLQMWPPSVQHPPPACSRFQDPIAANSRQNEPAALTAAVLASAPSSQPELQRLGDRPGLTPITREGAWAPCLAKVDGRSYPGADGRLHKSR